MISEYIKSIANITKQGDATEPSYYPALKTFLETYSYKQRHKKVVVTILPKKTEAGNPDFRVWDGKHSQIGYIEAKSPKTNLDDVEDSEQLTRYLETFPNLILTNFYEFRLYRDGEFVTKVLVARPFIAAKLRAIPPVEREQEFIALIEKFLQFELPTKFTAESLAKELATRTRFLRDQVIAVELAEKSGEESDKLRGFYVTFQKFLFANLKENEFADLYAQTLTYGLFAARTRANGKFDRKIAYDLIPRSIGILREIFHFVSFDPPEQLAVTVDDIAELLSVADVNAIMRDFYAKRQGSDPIYHFYETFLAEYDPKLREQRGVYYTPEPVVSFIVRSINIILKEKFNRTDGLATQKVTVLDPAAGTLTFLAESAKLAVKEYTNKYGKGAQNKFIEEHILKDFYAFELMMAPYAAGHLKMGFLLEELGHKLVGDERFQFFLTNTLEMDVLEQTTMPGMSSLSHESKEAHAVKNKTPILVVLGNPPYKGISSNVSEKEISVVEGQNYVGGYEIEKSEDHGRTKYWAKRIIKRAKKAMKARQKTWIGELIEDYKIIDGKWFGERKHWLQDDYVKFIRFAQWKIDQMGHGIIGFITNHSYLDNPTFRGMRQSLLNSFDDIYILDLHGNSLKKEKCPDGTKDENVFDIQQGVAIAIFVKTHSPARPPKVKENTARVFHADLWGLREDKYNFLRENNGTKTKFVELKPSSPNYFFIPRSEKHRTQYEQYFTITDIFPVNVTGIVTARDGFVIDLDKNNLKNKILRFRNLSQDNELIRNTYKLKDTRGWKLSNARKVLSKDNDWNKYFTEIMYRPFDRRHIYYTPVMVDWGRQELMRHMRQDNLSMVMPKRVETIIPWSHIYPSDIIIDHVLVSMKTVDYCFPLYLYPTTDKHDLFSGHEAGQRVPNISKNILKIGTPEDIFYYIYAILYSDAYRQKYAEFLKSDFPRVPFTSNKKVFKSLALKGEELIALHLLKSKVLDKPIIKFEGEDSNSVSMLDYHGKTGRLNINSKQYFTGIKPEVWSYQIGGYKVAEKWLKDRKLRKLSADEVSQYCRIITALSRTIEIQKTLDPLFEQAEAEILKID